MYDLESKLKPLGKEPHSVIGSTSIGASIVGGVCNNSVVTKESLEGDSKNLFNSASSKPITHLKITLLPDGGIARFRAYGEIWVDEKKYEINGTNVISKKSGAKAIFGYMIENIMIGHLKKCMMTDRKVYCYDLSVNNFFWIKNFIKSVLNILFLIAVKENFKNLISYLRYKIFCRNKNNFHIKKFIFPLNNKKNFYKKENITDLNEIGIIIKKTAI